jgi:hypothetical protein
MIEAARTPKRCFEVFITYLRHRVTNAASQYIKAKVPWVSYTARAVRNPRNFIHATYGGLDLASATR